MGNLTTTMTTTMTTTTATTTATTTGLIEQEQQLIASFVSLCNLLVLPFLPYILLFLFSTPVPQFLPCYKATLCTLRVFVSFLFTLRFFPNFFLFFLCVC